MPFSADFTPDLTEPSEAGFRVSPEHNSLSITGLEPIDISGLPGRLIVLEGTDGAGRSTQLALLREWLESQGFGVAHTALTRSRLAGDGLRKAKLGHTLGRTTMDLFYATDFASRLESHILPALRGGFVVLTDRYVYSTIARSIVRGSDPDWIRNLYRFAPTPHAIFYLKVDLEHLAPRVLQRGGFDFWESGMDFQEETDLYRSFLRYQTRLLGAFDQLAADYRFCVVDANRDVRPVFSDLRERILNVISGMEGARAGK